MKRNPKQMMQQLQVRSSHAPATRLAGWLAGWQAMPCMVRACLITECSLTLCARVAVYRCAYAGLHGPAYDAAAGRPGELDDNDEGDEQDGSQWHVPWAQITQHPTSTTTKQNETLAALLCFALLCLAIIGNTTILIVILVTGTRRRSHGWKATSETLWWSMKIGQFVIMSYHIIHSLDRAWSGSWLTRCVVASVLHLYQYPSAAHDPARSPAMVTA